MTVESRMHLQVIASFKIAKLLSCYISQIASKSFGPKQDMFVKHYHPTHEQMQITVSLLKFKKNMTNADIMGIIYLFLTQVKGQGQKVIYLII